jgi:hypothetical protein
MIASGIKPFAAEDWISKRLADELLERYLDWREEAVGVAEAYRRWDVSVARDRELSFGAYRAALDREEHAAAMYSVAAGELGGALWEGDSAMRTTRT